MKVLARSFAGGDGGGSDLAETSVTVTLVRAFDIDAELWTAIVRPVFALVNVCRRSNTVRCSSNNTTTTTTTITTIPQLSLVTTG